MLFKKVRRIALLCFTLLSLSSLFAVSSDMNIIPLSSPLYDYVDALYTLEGHAPAQGARPWNEADLKQQMARITPTSDASRRIVEIINEYLNRFDSKTEVDWNFSLTPSIAAHSNADKFDESNKWFSQVLNDKLIRLNLGLYTHDYFAANMGLSVGLMNSSNARGTATNVGTDEVPSYEYTFHDSSNEDRFNSVFSTNIPFLSAGSFDLDFTDNSFMSVGMPYVSATIARGQVSWGNGRMGNLMLGNTLPYHDYIGLQASNNTWFDYNMIVSFFTHPQNYYQGFTSEIHGIQMFIAHRFEFRMLKDKLRLTLNEAVMYHSPDNTVDFRAFSPLLILHGLYIPANANSLASLELEYAPIKNLQLYLSFALDDFALPNEPQPPENDSTLNMWGVMGGIRSTLPYKNGYFSFSLETVYTSPYMYHKDSYQERDNMDYVLDFVGSIRLSNGNFYRQYLGLPFGSDALAIYGGASYTVPYSYSAGVKLFFMMHGVTNVNSVVRKYDENGGDVPGFISTQNPFDPSERGEISFTYDVGLNGEYYVLKNLNFATSLDFVYIDNFEHGSSDEFDIQWTLSMKYSIY